MFWPIDVRMAVQDLGKLLDIIEKAVEAQVARRLAEYEECGQTPIAAGVPFSNAFRKLETVGDAFITSATHYRLWAYGGFVTTALAWLSDRLLLITNLSAHATYAVFCQTCGAPNDYRRERPLVPLLAEWVLDTALKERLELWVALRNRFVHSLGVVVDTEERDRLVTRLGIRFDSEARMQLMPNNCRDLLADIEAAAVAVAEKADIQ